VTSTSGGIRTVARKRLEERRGFVPHLIIYVVTNTGLVFVWVAAGGDSFFWPVFPILFWGAGLLAHGWSTFFTTPITDAEVDRETERLGHPPRSG
jgi:hypothetical protein